MSQRASQILLAGNNPKTMERLATALRDDHIVLRFARNAGQALQFIHDLPADLVLVDLELADNEGFGLLSQFKEHPPQSATIIIALAAAEDMTGQLRAFELGAHDCLALPEEPEVCRARLLAALQTKSRYDQLLRRNGELMKARTAAEAAARAKSDFLSAMSHEIRTPMNGVIAMASLLMETPLNAEQRSYLETIHASSESLLNIINEILDFSKIESGKMELDSRPFDLRSCIEETLDLLSAKAVEKNLDLVCLLDDSIPAVVKGDSLRLRQVLANLLSNAIKFTEHGRCFHPHQNAFHAAAPGRWRLTRCNCIFPYRTPASASGPTGWRGCSSRSCRPKFRPRGIMAARDWAWPSANGWSN